MHHPRLFKPESIANVQIEIQIVDTHESLETRVVIGLQALDQHLSRTLLILNVYSHWTPRFDQQVLDWGMRLICS